MGTTGAGSPPPIARYSSHVLFGNLLAQVAGQACWVGTSFKQFHCQAPLQKPDVPVSAHEAGGTGAVGTGTGAVGTGTGAVGTGAVGMGPETCEQKAKFFTTQSAKDLPEV